MGPECKYSFKDLYAAAYNKQPTADELQGLYALPQEIRNGIVKQWAEKAGWGVEDRLGTDGVNYTAFCPTFKEDTKLDAICRLV